MLMTLTANPFSHTLSIHAPKRTLFIHPKLTAGDLTHAGGAFRVDNDRIHVYIDSRLHPRPPNATFLSTRS